MPPAISSDKLQSLAFSLSALPDRLIPLEKVSLGENVRSQYDESFIIDLACNINEFGQLQPAWLIEEPESETYTVLFGHYRLLALQYLKAPTITAKVISRDQAPAAELVLNTRLSENIMRQEMSEADRMECYQRLRDEFGYQPKDLSHLFGTACANIYKVLSAGDKLRYLKDLGVEAGDLSINQCRDLPADKESLQTFAQMVSDQNLELTGQAVLAEVLKRKNRGPQDPEPLVPAANLQLSENEGRPALPGAARGGLMDRDPDEEDEDDGERSAQDDGEISPDRDPDARPPKASGDPTRIVELAITLSEDNKVLKIRAKHKSTFLFALEKLILGQVLESE